LPPAGKEVSRFCLVWSFLPAVRADLLRLFLPGPAAPLPVLLILPLFLRLAGGAKVAVFLDKVRTLGICTRFHGSFSFSVSAQIRSQAYRFVGCRDALRALFFLLGKIALEAERLRVPLVPDIDMLMLPLASAVVALAAILPKPIGAGAVLRELAYFPPGLAFRAVLYFHPFFFLVALACP
jgi:hypothetical protein